MMLLKKAIYDKLFAKNNATDTSWFPCRIYAECRI